MHSRVDYCVFSITFALLSLQLSFKPTRASSIPGFFFQCDGMQGADVLKCDGKTVILTSPDGGNVTLMPGAGGHVMIGDSVWDEGVSSSPPIWTKHFHGGNLGVYAAYSDVSVSIGAEDPEGGWVTYSVVSGSLPPGLELDSQTGQIKGTAPALHALFSFNVQATDSDGRTADAVFTIDILESYYHCVGDPCKNNGTCVDRVEGGFFCHCPEGFGGPDCSQYCPSNALGVSNVSAITDDQMSAKFSYSSSFPPNYGRLNYPQTEGWRLRYTGDWLQINFVDLVAVHAVAIQGYGSSNGVSQFYLSYSIGGATFNTYTYNGSTRYFSGHRSDAIYHSNLPAAVNLTDIRFHPTSYNIPCLRVEVYGCCV